MAVVATISKGYDLDYIWKQVDRGLVKDAASYYIQASESGGEPPGRWWGPGAKALGFDHGQLSRSVDLCDQGLPLAGLRRVALNSWSGRLFRSSLRFRLLQFLSGWLARDPGRLGASLADYVGHPAYNVGELRQDLDRFTFLLGGDDGESLFGSG